MLVQTIVSPTITLPTGAYTTIGSNLVGSSLTFSDGTRGFINSYSQTVEQFSNVIKTVVRYTYETTAASTWNGLYETTWNYPINTTSATTCYTDGDTLFYPSVSAWAYTPPLTAAQRLKEVLNKRMAPNIISTRKPLGYTDDIREVRARETLRRVVGEFKFKDFVRKGSISVKAKSGLTYQIFPGSDFTKVYNCGKMIERLCVVLVGGFPPTDSLIMRFLMILNNEQQFRGYAIKHSAYNYEPPAIHLDSRSLPEIFKGLKAA